MTELLIKSLFSKCILLIFFKKAAPPYKKAELFLNWASDIYNEFDLSIYKAPPEDFSFLLLTELFTNFDSFNILIFPESSKYTPPPLLSAKQFINSEFYILTFLSNKIKYIHVYKEKIL